MLKGISDDLEAFYGNVVEHLAGYVAPAPKLPKELGAAPIDPVVHEPVREPGTEVFAAGASAPVEPGLVSPVGQPELDSPG